VTKNGRLHCLDALYNSIDLINELYECQPELPDNIVVQKIVVLLFLFFAEKYLVLSIDSALETLNFM
jgi:hypothetical protein